MATTILALQFSINDGLTVRPIFMGALRADILTSIAEVPSFAPTTAHYTIAGNVIRPPIKDWQRPLDPKKVEAITKRFNTPGEFMPNPVLLAVHLPDRVKVEEKVLNGQHTGVYELIVDNDPAGNKPLWVLDGQHRLRGIAETTNGDNPIPFVLLHSPAAGVYMPQDFAKIFAEVSTEATPLSGLHSEWLQFAFRLGQYNTAAPPPVGHLADNEHRSMQVAAILCDQQNFSDGAIQNPYFDKIQFNPEREPQPVHGYGFLFSGPQLKEWIFDEYYNQPTQLGHLEPESVAREIARATLSLTQTITTNAANSAFFGEGAKRHQYIERAFICGVLTHLLVHPTPDWQALLESLKFQTADWDLTWVNTTGGSAGNISKRIARNVFCQAFRTGQLPTGTADLVTYLRGDKAAVHLVGSFVNESGRPKTANKQEVSEVLEGVRVFFTEGRQHVRLKSGDPFTANVGKLVIYDPLEPMGSKYTASTLKTGVILESKQELRVHGHLYGGLENALKLTIRPD